MITCGEFMEEKKLRKRMTMEEKYIDLQSGLRYEMWKAISFKNTNQLLKKANAMEEINFEEFGFSTEKTIIFFMDFFDLILRSRLLTVDEKSLLELKKILYKKGIKSLIEKEDDVNVKLLNYKYEDCDMFYPTKILTQVLYGDKKEFSKLVGFLTEGEYPQDCILQKWTNTFGVDRYLEEF